MKCQKLYDRADIYLNSPNIDNMPNSIIEAFAAGTLVISTNAGGIPYIVTDKESGILVKPDDFESMAMAAVSVLEDSVVGCRLIDVAYAESQKYLWTSVKENWLSLYRELATK